jgi:hypothetical protein
MISAKKLRAFSIKIEVDAGIWAKHRFSIEKWCIKQFGYVGWCNWGYTFYFTKMEDVQLFQLTWNDP